jgi:ubiquinone/menaquinone biosynthesis C-methylase UbiE
MTKDQSQFYYGQIYHKLLDPPLEEARKVAVDLIPEGSSVLDIGCGTGQLCFELKAKKNCRVIGLDLSLRMLDFARKTIPYEDIVFIHKDATDLAGFEDHSFDYATLLFLMHELPRPQQLRVFGEALRVAERTVIIDSVAPLPKNIGGVGIRIVEAIFGRDHNQHFKNFLATGGIEGLVKDLAFPITVAYQSVFWRRCRQVVVVSR